MVPLARSSATVPNSSRGRITLSCSDHTRHLMRRLWPWKERRNIQLTNQYRIVVGDVGIVFRGSRLEGLRHFNQYVIQSETVSSAIFGRSVALFKDEKIIREF